MSLTESTIAWRGASIKKLVKFHFGFISTFLLITPASYGNSTGQTNTEKPLSELCQRGDVAVDSEEMALNLSRAAENRGDVAKAASYAVTSVCAFHRQNEDETRFIELASNAIERLLEADDMQRAAAMLSIARDSIDTIKIVEPTASVRFKLATARFLSFQDKNSEALALRTEITGAVDALFGASSPEAMENRLRIANLQIESGEITRSLSALDSLSLQAMEHPELNARLRLLILESKAIALAFAGREPEAISLLEIAKKQIQSNDTTIGCREIDLDEEIASILFREEKFDEALVMQSSVILQRQKNFPDQKNRLQEGLWKLASFYTSIQRIEAAKAILLIIEKNLESSEPRIESQLLWQTRSRLANIEARNGNFAEAAERWRRVYLGEREILGEDALDTQIEKSNFATALSQSGEAAKACPILEEVLERQTALRPDDLWAIEFTRVSLARCFLRQGGAQKIGEARELLLRASARLSGNHEGDGAHALLAISALAMADLMSDRRAEAKLLLSNLVAKAEASRQRDMPGLVSRDSAFYTWVVGLAANGDGVLGYRQLALLHAEDDELERALRVSELARDRTLGDHFAEQEWLRNALPPEERQRLEPVLESIQSLDERLAVAPDLMERVRLESERAIAVAQRGRMERELRERLHLAEPESVPPTLDQLREHLDGRTALVSLMHSGDLWWMLVVTRDAPARFVPLRDADLGRNAAAWVRRLRGEPVRAWPMAQGGIAIDDLRPAGAAGPYLSTDQLGARLSAGLLEPLAAAAGTARHLVFVGDDELVGVPLQALPLGGALAVDRFDISYAPSLTTYARWQGRHRNRFPRDLLAIGAVATAPRANSGGDDTLAIALAYATDQPLPYAREEIDAIGALFAADRRRSLTGAAARKSWLRQASRSGELAGYRYVHLATHAWADADQPEASAVLLASDGTEPPLQVVLTAAELAGLQMGADLIVLSACDTGAGHFEHGRGLLGMAYAALAAGNRAAVLSLWPIADDTTAAFMRGFYRHLRRGTDPAAALAATQREYRASSDPRLANPSVWAPFLVYGGY
jgi:hypothetical protein